MKDNLLDGHRGKVALSDTTRNQQPGSISNSSGGGKCDLKAPSAVAAAVGGSNSGGGNSDGTATTNFDDDYNEWELGIGDLIIDLDADIEKTNERISQHHAAHHHQNGSLPSSSVSNSSTLIASPTSNASFSFLGPSQSPCGSNAAMSNSKSSRSTLASGTGSTSATSASNSGSCVLISGVGNGSSASGSANGQSGAVEHQATVDKGLKMKIKRKTVGSKYSEAKHEIVQSDTKTVTENGTASSGGASGSCGGAGLNPSAGLGETPKSKHSSSKGRNGSHREKKEKNRDKEKGSSARATNPPVEMNGGLGVMSPSLKITSSGVSLSSPSAPASAVVSPPSTAATALQQNCPVGVASPRSGPVVPTCASAVAGPPLASGGGSCSSSSSSSNSGTSSTSSGMEATPTTFTSSSCSTPQALTLPSSSPPASNLTLKLESKFSPSTTACSVVVKQEEVPSSPPLKKLKCEPVDAEVDGISSPIPPEMKDTSTCTSVGTITEPDCLGPCEPGTSVMLEGIVWQETEGGVLVVNVTWRGKTYVGTLLDCTKHDWAPPRFCESPTSDVDNKATKGRGKRGRGANNNCSEMSTFDVRNCVQSKLRNGKGRRTTINSSNFTVPSSPAKSDSGAPSSSKRKGRPSDLELTPGQEGKVSLKRSRVQSRGGTPTASGSSSNEFPQPSSPVLIECPEPNCNKKYKHINGLRYHQQHAHSGSSDGNKLDDTTTEDSKDVTNSSDNEESAQENTSVPPSPAMSFANSVSPHPNRPLPGENNSSSSSNVPSLPESDPYTLTPDLSTLASVAISDSKTVEKCTTPTLLHATASQELPVIVSTDGPKSLPSVLQPVSSCSPVPAAPAIVPVGAPAEGLSPVVPAASSVIHSSSASDASNVSPAVTVSIPTSHVVFNQGISAGINCITTTHSPSVTMASHNSVSQQSPRTSLSTVSASTFVPVVSSAPVASPSATSSPSDKSKSKQPTERLDKYKPKSPVASPAIRPIVPAPPAQLIALPSPHPGVTAVGHGLVTSSLKPIQPKPTILGEPSTINPALESLKKDKSKHKKKSKDRERKSGAMPLTPVKLSSHPNEDCEPMEMSPYPSLEAVAGSRDAMAASAGAAPAAHPSMAALDGHKPPEAPLEMSLADDTLNENIQSPAYSDISDANDTAPVLESEVPSVKEKEDKVGKGPPDAAQSPAANITAYGMYSYYSQPPYLLPSVSPQSSVPANPAPSVIEKPEQTKKLDQERIKETRPWSSPAGDIRERSAAEAEPSEKKSSRENSTPNPSVISSPASANVPLQDYQVQQPYPYSYGYVQGYPFSVEPAYHMHLLDSDPHYKQQYKHFVEEQQRLYKEHHHQQQQQHHNQSQQQQQHSHQSHHHSQHQPHHQSKLHHSSMLKEERDRSREHKDRSSSSDKIASAGSHGDHISKIQHSSLSLISSKEHELRDQPDGRPPSLPTQSRGENTTPSSAPASLKEKQNENHQILKENIELKSQMDDSKNKINQFEMAMIYERHREDMRRYYMLQERIIEQQQQKMEPGYHHHTHHHQTIQPHQIPSHSISSKSHKDELQASVSSHSKQSHYVEGSRSSTVMSPAKPDHVKASSHPHSSSSPKGGMRDSSVGMSKEYSSSSGRDSSSSKKESLSGKSSDRLDGSSRDEKCKSEKIKLEAKQEPEGQKPTMETTGPPPPPTNAYAYLHPSYLQPPPPHFPHMPFEPAHAVYRAGLNPMIMSTPSPYGSSPYMHPQLRYVPPGACEIPAAHSQQPDPLAKGLHQPGPPKALDLLHQVSQHYTTHKIHELQEHALMSPTPTSTPVSSTTPSTSSSTVSSKIASSEPTVALSKGDAASNRDSSRSPPTQRHLHTHHHTHVGVGYPIYDPYGVAVQKPCT